MNDIKNDRYEDEICFFDNKSEEILRKKKRFTLKNTKNYEILFNDIIQLVPIVRFFGNITEKKILDLCCGEGWASLYFARSGASVYSCDISPKSIDLVNKYADANGLSGKIIAEVMSAENLKYEDNFFDYVFMNAALHHCHVEKVATEIKRILRPGGKAALIEDNAYHPILNIYRYFTKNKHTKYEKSITREDVIVFCNKFSSHEISYHRLFNIFDEEKYYTNILNNLDDLVINKYPKYMKYARLIDIFVVK